MCVFFKAIELFQECATKSIISISITFLWEFYSFRVRFLSFVVYNHDAFMIKYINKIFILPVRFYQIFLSPMLGSNCRYQPTCSQYMIEAINEWGPIKGIYLGVKRIGRCHPWAGHGPDPVPKKDIK